MNITIDFEGAIQRALAPEALDPILDKHIKAAINSAIEDATGYRSEFQKSLKAQLAEALPHGLGVDDVAKFQHILNGALQAVVAEANGAAIEAAMKKVVARVLPETPAALKLSAFVETMRDGLHKEAGEAFYAFMEQSHSVTHIYFDKNEKPGGIRGYDTRENMKYQAEYSLAVNKDGEVYSLKLRGKEVTPTNFPNVVGSFDAALMAMYVGRTSLEIDMNDDDLESESGEQYE